MSGPRSFEFGSFVKVTIHSPRGDQLLVFNVSHSFSFPSSFSILSTPVIFLQHLCKSSFASSLILPPLLPNGLAFSQRGVTPHSSTLFLPLRPIFSMIVLPPKPPFSDESICSTWYFLEIGRCSPEVRVYVEG